MKPSEESPGRTSDSTGGFVGRERELEQLRAGLEATLAGHGQLFLLSGEPGIGKTRLADQLGTIASSCDFRVIWGRCWEGWRSPSLLAMGASIPRDRIDWRGVAIYRGWRRFRPGSRSTPTLPMATSEPDHHRFQLFDSLNSQLQQASHEAPLLIVLDDCHYADAASMSLLKFIARDLRQSRAMLIVTYREIEAQLSPFLPALLAEIGRGVRRSLCVGCPRRMSADSSQRVPAARLRPLSHKSCLRITEGNPFFLGEMVRLLLAEGQLATRHPRAEGLSHSRRRARCDPSARGDSTACYPYHSCPSFSDRA